MAKILLGWELGGGFGHAASLTALAQALMRAGHTPVLALAEVEGTRPVWEGKGFDVVPAPGFKQTSTGAIRHETLADVMVDTGVFTTDRLAKLCQAWGTVFARIKPQVVVCDFAPSLALYARGRSPTIVVGTSYGIPPAGRSFPPMRFWQPGKPSNAARRNEKHLLDAFSAAAALIGNPPFQHGTDILGGDEVFVCSLPEIDCYGALRTSAGIGSLTASGGPARAPEASGLFAYLASNADLPKWIAGIAASGVAAEAFVRGATVEAPPSILIHEKLVDLGTVLPHKLLLLHHGGTLAEFALRAGLPQLIIPRSLEQGIVGRLIAACGAGELIEPAAARDPRTLGGTIRRMTEDSNTQDKAQNVAAAIAARQAPAAVEIVVKAIGKYA